MSRSSPSSAQSPTPQLLLLGLRRSGKTSLLSVLHKRLAPEETLFLDNTTRATPTHLDIWKGVTIWDGLNLTALLNEPGEDMVGAGTRLRWTEVRGVVWVVDSQDDYLDSLSTLHSVILRAFAHNPSIHFHILLHKMDGLSEDYRDDTQTDVEKRIEDDLSDASSSFTFARGVGTSPLAAKARSGAGSEVQEEEEEEEEGHINLDWEELEKVARERRYGKTTSSSPSPPENDLLLKKLSSNNPSSRASSAVRPSRSRRRSSRNNHGPNQSANLETDVHLTLHQTSIFDSSIFVAFSRLLNPLILSPPSMRSALGRLMDSLVETCEMEKAFLMHLPTRTWLLTDGGPFEKGAFEVVCDYLGFMTGIASLFENVNKKRPGDDEEGREEEKTARGEEVPTVPARTHASSTLRLSPDLLLCFWQLDNALGLVAILRSSPLLPLPSSGTTMAAGVGMNTSVTTLATPGINGASSSAEKRFSSPGGVGGAGVARGSESGTSLTGLLDCNVDVFRKAVVHGLGKLSSGAKKEEVLKAFLEQRY